MVFSSTIFLFIFLPIVFLLNYALPHKFRNILLLICSLIFYSWGEPVFILIMIFSIFANYYLAIRIEHNKEISTKKIWVTVAVIFNLLVLIVFKYTNFIVDNINGILSTAIDVPQIQLPIGISFFTFQAMSYVIDVYRDRTKAQRKLGDLALYISFFPQLIAGPIVKYHDIANQIKSRYPTIEKIALGIRRFIVGLGKKILIANVLGEVADSIFALKISDINLPIAWLGAISYTLQIYYDFSGYSDMAIGLGGMFGFNIKENFNYPFTATSIKDFWRRWHISLSTWFKEYLYIPLGGNRKGKLRTPINLWIVFLCTGIWHGSQWTFVLWGAFHGFFLMLETLKIIKIKRCKMNVVSRVYTLLIVVVSFAIFRAETIEQAFEFITVMFTGFQFGSYYQSLLGEIITPLVVLISILSIIFSMPISRYINSKAVSDERLTLFTNTVSYLSSVILLMLCILALSSSTYNPFIYFRF